MNNNFTVPDICDAFVDEIKVGDVFFHSFGGNDKFCGEIKIANCPHSNSIVKEMVEEDHKAARRLALLKKHDLELPVSIKS